MTMPGRQLHESAEAYGQRMANAMVGIAELERTQNLAEMIKSRHGPVGNGQVTRVCSCGASWPCDVMALAECVASLAWTLGAAAQNGAGNVDGLR